MAGHYLKEADLRAALDSGDRERLGNLFLLLARNVVRLYRLPPWVDREDVIQNCVLYALKQMPRYRPEKGKAFSYFTGAVRFAILTEIKSASRYHGRHTGLIENRDSPDK